MARGLTLFLSGWSQALAAAATTGDPSAGDVISGLLADTPIPPHLRQQLAVALRSHDAAGGGRGEDADPLLSAGLASVAEQLADPGALGGGGGIAEACREGGELRIADLEAAFAREACSRLLAAPGGVFDLARLQRLLAAFRGAAADACSGTARGTAPGAGAQLAAAEGVREEAVDALALRKAELAVARQLLELHQRLFASEARVGDKHAELVGCYQRMADRAKEFTALQGQLGKVRGELHREMQGAQAC